MISMKYLLDTNVLIAMFKGNKVIREAILSADPDQCVVSDLTIGELLIGAYKGGNRRQWDQVMETKRKFSNLSVTPEVIELYAKTRARLELQGIRLDTIDLLIGCTALFYNLTILTHNVKHFSHIPDLKIEDWETETSSH